MPLWVWIVFGGVVLIGGFFIWRFFFAPSRKYPPGTAEAIRKGMARQRQRQESDVARDVARRLIQETIFCINCDAIYERAEVIRQLKQQSPEIFAFSSWETRFICKKCRAENVISGTGNE